MCVKLSREEHRKLLGVVLADDYDFYSTVLKREEVFPPLSQGQSTSTPPSETPSLKNEEEEKKNRVSVQELTA